VLSVECSGGLFLALVDLVRVPLECWLVEQFAAHADLVDELLVLHVTMRESRKFATLPAEVADENAVVQRSEKE